MVAGKPFRLKVRTFFPSHVNMKATIELRVLNALGLHARPASEFVRCALKFRGTALLLRKGDQTFAPTSILEILTAELDQGAAFSLEADGPEAETALQEFAALLVRFRDEEQGANG